jgi:hypothetical protein
MVLMFLVCQNTGITSEILKTSGFPDRLIRKGQMGSSHSLTQSWKTGIEDHRLRLLDGAPGLPLFVADGQIYYTEVPVRVKCPFLINDNAVRSRDQAPRSHLDNCAKLILNHSQLFRNSV